MTKRIARTDIKKGAEAPFSYFLLFIIDFCTNDTMALAKQTKLI